MLVEGYGDLVGQVVLRVVHGPGLRGEQGVLAHSAGAAPRPHSPGLQEKPAGPQPLRLVMGNQPGGKRLCPKTPPRAAGALLLRLRSPARPRRVPRASLSAAVFGRLGQGSTCEELSLAGHLRDYDELGKKAEKPLLPRAQETLGVGVRARVHGAVRHGAPGLPLPARGSDVEPWSAASARQDEAGAHRGGASGTSEPLPTRARLLPEVPVEMLSNPLGQRAPDVFT